MSKSIYVGNIPLRATADDLAGWFTAYGTVTGARVVSDRGTGRPLGFGHVEMGDGGDAAIAALHGSLLEGRTLTVSASRPRGRRPAGPGRR